MSKICPLMLAGTAGLKDCECRPDKCAWACEDRCAVATLARRLDDLNKRGIIQTNRVTTG